MDPTGTGRTTDTTGVGVGVGIGTAAEGMRAEEELNKVELFKFVADSKPGLEQLLNNKIVINKNMLLLKMLFNFFIFFIVGKFCFYFSKIIMRDPELSQIKNSP